MGIWKSKVALNFFEIECRRIRISVCVLEYDEVRHLSSSSQTSYFVLFLGVSAGFPADWSRNLRRLFGVVYVHHHPVEWGVYA